MQHVGHVGRRLPLHHRVGVVVDDRCDLAAREDEEAHPVAPGLPARLRVRDEHPGQPDRDVEVPGELEDRPRLQRGVQQLESGGPLPVLVAQAAEGLLDRGQLALERVDDVLIGSHGALSSGGAPTRRSSREYPPAGRRSSNPLTSRGCGDRVQSSLVSRSPRGSQSARTRIPGRATRCPPDLSRSSAPCPGRLQLSREYCTDSAVATLSHTAYGARTPPARGRDRATSATSTQVRTAATARARVAAPIRCGT